MALGLQPPSVGGESQPAGPIPIAGEQGSAPLQPDIQEPPTGDEYCQTCHANHSLTAGFTNGQPFSLYVDPRNLRDSAHNLFSCVTCHDQLGAHPAETPQTFDFAVYKSDAVEMCTRCHEAAVSGYAQSAHWKQLFGRDEGATCIDCHSPDGSGHSVPPTSDRRSALGPARVADVCGNCHQQALASYSGTSHGKVARFGDATTTATCVTCHNDHGVRPVAELSGPGAGSQLAGICRECHEGADESFARAWPGHSEGASSGSAAGLIERIGYVMAAGVVAFGLVHASLDSVRRLTDRGGR